MIATAWDNVPEQKQEADLPLQHKLHIERIELSNILEKKDPTKLNIMVGFDGFVDHRRMHQLRCV